MPRRARLMLAALVLALSAAGTTTAAAAIDPTTTGVSCDPASVATGAPTTCTVTVTDTAATSPSAPTGPVTFSAAPNTGSFASSGTCMPVPGGATSSSCSVTFTATEGGQYTLRAEFTGDPAHDVSSGQAAVTVVDPTSTTLSCTDSGPSVNTGVNCTATLTDTGSPRQPVGQVTFTSDPSTGVLSSPGPCPWTPADGGMGGTATCQVAFSASAAGAYTLTASYGGDTTHAASAGRTQIAVTATTPGSSSDSGVSEPVGALEPSTPDFAPGVVSIAAAKAKVSKRRVAKVRLGCTGATGATCDGVLAMVAPIRVKVKVRRKVHKGTKTKTVTRTRLLRLGPIVSYSLGAGKVSTVPVKLTKRAYRLLIRTRRQRLQTTTSANEAVHKVILAPAHKVKVARHRPKKRKSKHRRHRTHKQT